VNQKKRNYNENLSPIALFVYNRLDTLENLILSLKQNPESEESNLIIFSDGPILNDSIDILEVKKVRKFIKDIEGFKTIKIVENIKNEGLASSIIQGLNSMSDLYDSFIVLEDDLVVSKYFLKYMNTSLQKYKNNNKVWCVNGFGTDPALFNLPENLRNEFYWSLRPSSHGWGTWSNRWNEAIWDETDLEMMLKKRSSKKRVLRAGADIFSMFNLQLKKNIDSWAVRWVVNACINNKYCLNPVYSYTTHQFSLKGTHIKGNNHKIINNLNLSKSELTYPKNFDLNKVIIKKLQHNVFGPKRFEKVKYRLKVTNNYLNSILKRTLEKFSI